MIRSTLFGALEVCSVAKKIAEDGFYFHANEDPPEVRERFFRFIKTLDCSVEIVVGRKIPSLFAKKHNNRESEFYAQQSQLLGNILSFLAIVITSIMAVGAVFGAINTMYAAIASRAPEIGVLLTLGFTPSSVLVSFLAESAIIAAIGGILGCLFALPLNGIVTSTTNWSSFSEIAFSFRVTPQLLLAGLIFAVVMGVVGGFFPALRAARLQVVQALR